MCPYSPVLSDAPLLCERRWSFSIWVALRSVSVQPNVPVCRRCPRSVGLGRSLLWHYCPSRHLRSLRRREWSSVYRVCRCNFASTVQQSTIQLSELVFPLWAGPSRAAVWETRILALLPSVIEIVSTTFWIVLMTLACWQPEGQRKQARPRVRWTDGLEALYN